MPAEMRCSPSPYFSGSFSSRKGKFIPFYGNVQRQKLRLHANAATASDDFLSHEYDRNHIMIMHSSLVILTVYLLDQNLLSLDTRNLSTRSFDIHTLRRRNTSLVQSRGTKKPQPRSGLAFVENVRRRRLYGLTSSPGTRIRQAFSQ